MKLSEKIGICVIAAGRLDRGKFAEYEAIRDAAFLADFTWRESRITDFDTGEYVIVGIFFMHNNEYYYFSACEHTKDEEMNSKDHDLRRFFDEENKKRAAKAV